VAWQRSQSGKRPGVLAEELRDLLDDLRRKGIHLVVVGAKEGMATAYRMLDSWVDFAFHREGRYIGRVCRGGGQCDRGCQARREGQW